MSEMTWACAAALRSMASRPLARGGLVEPPAAQQVGPPHDGGQRRAQLVGERGQELVLDAAGRLRLRARPLRLLEQALALPVVVLALRDVAGERAEAESPPSGIAVMVSSRGKTRAVPRAAPPAPRGRSRDPRPPSSRGQASPRKRRAPPRAGSTRQVAPTASVAGSAERLLGLRVPEGDAPPPSRAMTASSVLSRIERTWAALERRRSATRPEAVTASTLAPRGRAHKRPLPSIGSAVVSAVMRLGITEFIDCAHFLPGHPKCGQVHGHTYKVEVVIEGESSAAAWSWTSTTSRRARARCCRSTTIGTGTTCWSSPRVENICALLSRQLKERIAFPLVIRVWEGNGKWAEM